MNMHAKKRIEIFVEAPLVEQVTERLTEAEVSGYSVVPIASGCGIDGIWAAEGQISTATQMMMVICITDAAKLKRAVDSVYALLTRQIGFITVSDVQVVRADRF